MARIEVMDAPRPNVTSAMLRDWVSRGESILYTTPFVVQRIIGKRGLYETKAAPAKSKAAGAPAAGKSPAPAGKRAPAKKAGTAQKAPARKKAGK